MAQKKVTAKTSATPVGLGFRAIRGGSMVVGVALNGREPRVLLSHFLPTAAQGDRLAFEPYHVAAGMCRHGLVSAEAAAAVSEGRKRQAQMAADGLKRLVRELRESKCQLVAAGLLINRAGWITDLLEHSLSAPEHPPVAEGLAVRDALRSALDQSGIAFVEMDEKTLPEAASKKLRLSIADIDRRLKSLGAGPPWRKEQKLACLSAWLAAWLAVKSH